MLVVIFQPASVVMTDLRKLEVPQLIDMLSTYTSYYTRMFAEQYKGSAIAQCEFYICLLQQELKLRALAPELPTNSTPIQLAGTKSS